MLTICCVELYVNAKPKLLKIELHAVVLVITALQTLQAVQNLFIFFLFSTVIYCSDYYDVFVQRKTQLYVKIIWTLRQKASVLY